MIFPITVSNSFFTSCNFVLSGNSYIEIQEGNQRLSTEGETGEGVETKKPKTKMNLNFLDLSLLTKCINVKL